MLLLVALPLVLLLIALPLLLLATREVVSSLAGMVVDIVAVTDSRDSSCSEGTVQVAVGMVATDIVVGKMFEWGGIVETAPKVEMLDVVAKEVTEVVAIEVVAGFTAS